MFWPLSTPSSGQCWPYLRDTVHLSLILNSPPHSRVAPTWSPGEERGRKHLDPFLVLSQHHGWSTPVHLGADCVLSLCRGRCLSNLGVVSVDGARSPKEGPRVPSDMRSSFPSPTCAACMTRGNSFHVSEPPAPHLQTGGHDLGLTGGYVLLYSMHRDMYEYSAWHTVGAQ